MVRDSILAMAAAASLLAAPAVAGDAPILGYDLFGSGPEKVVVFHDWMGDATNYDVTADGQRFVMIREDERARKLHVVVNWFDELERLVPAE